MVLLPDPVRILSELKKRLSPGRFRHTLAVAGLAERLAGRHGEDPARARIAGLLHDWAKEMTGPQLVGYARRHGLRIPGFSLVEKRAPHLMHAYVSADAVSRRFRIKDRELLSAIAHHTLGAPKMGTLEKIIYVADMASPDRGFPEARAVRALALRALEPAFREALKVKIRHILTGNKILHPMAVTVWNQTCEI
jgi:predicted HD superfamily hydrolase involved in NAD metabolism